MPEEKAKEVATPKPAEKPAETPKPAAETAKAPETPAKVVVEGSKSIPTPELELPKDPGPPETISDEEADKLDAEHGGETSKNDDSHTVTAMQDAAKEYNGAAARVGAFIEQLHHKPDNFTIYGYGGKLISLGDLRALIGPYVISNRRD